MEGIQKVYDFLEKAGTFYLATVEGDQPRVRPYGGMLLFCYNDNRMDDETTSESCINSRTFWN